MTEAALFLANAFVWGLAIAVIGAVILLVLAIVEHELALKRAAQRDVELAALKAVGVNRFNPTDVRV